MCVASSRRSGVLDWHTRPSVAEADRAGELRVRLHTVEVGIIAARAAEPLPLAISKRADAEDVPYLVQNDMLEHPRNGRCGEDHNARVSAKQGSSNSSSALLSRHPPDAAIRPTLLDLHVGDEVAIGDSRALIEAEAAAQCRRERKGVGGRQIDGVAEVLE